MFFKTQYMSYVHSTVRYSIIHKNLKHTVIHYVYNLYMSQHGILCNSNLRMHVQSNQFKPFEINNGFLHTYVLQRINYLKST